MSNRVEREAMVFTKYFIPIILLFGLLNFLFGCAKKNNNNIYNIIELSNVCNDLIEGDSYHINPNTTVTIHEGNCYIEINQGDNNE